MVGRNLLFRIVESKFSQLIVNHFIVSFFVSSNYVHRIS
jgi:hypothetical protein